MLVLDGFLSYLVSFESLLSFLSKIFYDFSSLVPPAELREEDELEPIFSLFYLP